MHKGVVEKFDHAIDTLVQLSSVGLIEICNFAHLRHEQWFAGFLGSSFCIFKRFKIGVLAQAELGMVYGQVALCAQFRHFFA